MMPSMEELNNLAVAEASANNNKWGIDKKIPVALILVVVFQTIAITWGAATLSSDVKNYGAKIVKIEADFEKFVEKTDLKYETKTGHTLDKENTFGEIRDIKMDINRLNDRVRDLEKRL